MNLGSRKLFITGIAITSIIACLVLISFLNALHQASVHIKVYGCTLATKPLSSRLILFVNGGFSIHWVIRFEDTISGLDLPINVDVSLCGKVLTSPFPSGHFPP